MNNPADQGSSACTSTTARTDQHELHESKVMVLRSKDIVKLTNLTAKTRGIFEAYHCNRRNKRLRTDELQIVEASAAQSFLHKQQSWMLHGDVCINVEGRTGFHLKLKLSAGNLGESVKLVADLQQYPSDDEWDSDWEDFNDFIRKIESFVFTITLLDKNFKDIGSTRCFQFAKQLFHSRNALHLCNDNFCSESVLMQACQISPAGANTLKTSSEFEFIDVKIETTIRLEETRKLLNNISAIAGNTPCSTQAFQRKLSSSKDYSSSKTEGIPECPLKFTEIVGLKTGGRSPQKSYVYKDKLIQESPVFARMFDTSMSEKSTGEVTLKDCTVPVLEAFVCFLYENKSDSRFEDHVEILLGVLALAHQKGTNRIVQRAKEMIISVGNKLLNLELALSIFTAGDLYEMPDLKFRAVQWISCNKIQLQTAEGRKQVQAVIDANKDVGSSIIAEILTIL